MNFFTNIELKTETNKFILTEKAVKFVFFY